jgi:hypothetical protein
MALPTLRRILGDEKAFAYFEGSLKKSREQHPFLGRSYPESAASFEHAVCQNEKNLFSHFFSEGDWT